MTNTDDTVYLLMNFSGTEPLFIQLANYYERLVRLGVYKEGDPLPSVREIALSEGINPNTVVHAFSLLVDKGIVSSIPKKGYYVNKAPEEESGGELHDIFEKLLAKGYSLDDLEKALLAMKGAKND